MSELERLLARVFGAFDSRAGFVTGVQHGSGHINDTYLVTLDQSGAPARCILQRLNTAVFKDPRGLMANILHVTRHLRRALLAAGVADPEQRVLTLLHAKDGRCFIDDAELGFWRAYRFIEGGRTCDRLEHPDQAYQAAKAFGTFQRLLVDYEGPRLAETIPFFHHTRRRFEAFRQALAADPLARAAGAAREIDFALRRETLADRLLDLQASGAVPERITHNDTKLNNVMLDEASGEGLCVLDLDTVMPGLSLYDFGDMVRSSCNLAAEDETDLSLVSASGEVFAALAGGYLAGTGGALLPVEREHLAVAGQVITYECGLRFLTDHLLGDGYFRIHRPDQNLDRARNQFALLRSLEAQSDAFLRRVRAL
jgi:aminoglycoside phosphotransferase (APT) family kinase protein